MSRRDRGGLSDEDAALWAHVTRSMTRMPARQRANRPTIEAAADGKALPHRSSTPPSHFQPHGAGPREAAALPVVTAHAPTQHAIEPRKAKRVARGREGIEARIDLHGMRQIEAHGALRAFLHRAYSNGCRMVLVITGKGRESDADSHAPFEMYQERDRGVLRRNVPRWLAEPDLRMIVVGFTSAHVRHGGDGAFYVQLRNAEKYRG